MASIFDGISGMLSATFGAQVEYQPQGGSPRAIQSVFRNMPIEVAGSDGHPILTTAATWRVHASLVPELRRGDRILPGDGKTYAILNIHPTGSPAADAAVICELERIVQP
jgi:hypothetical protein